jgi:hypothetical protein
MQNIMQNNQKLWEIIIPMPEIYMYRYRGLEINYNDLTPFRAFRILLFTRNEKIQNITFIFEDNYFELYFDLFQNNISNFHNFNALFNSFLNDVKEHDSSIDINIIRNDILSKITEYNSKLFMNIGTDFEKTFRNAILYYSNFLYSVNNTLHPLVLEQFAEQKLKPYLGLNIGKFLNSENEPKKFKRKRGDIVYT